MMKFNHFAYSIEHLQKLLNSVLFRGYCDMLSWGFFGKVGANKVGSKNIVTTLG